MRVPAVEVASPLLYSVHDLNSVDRALYTEKVICCTPVKNIIVWIVLSTVCRGCCRTLRATKRVSSEY